MYYRTLKLPSELNPMTILDLRWASDIFEKADMSGDLGEFTHTQRPLVSESTKIGQ